MCLLHYIKRHIHLQYTHIPFISNAYPKFERLKLSQPVFPSLAHRLPDGQRHVISKVGAHLSQDLGIILEDPKDIERWSIMFTISSPAKWRPLDFRGKSPELSGHCGTSIASATCHIECQKRWQNMTEYMPNRMHQIARESQSMSRMSEYMPNRIRVGVDHSKKVI